MSDLADRPCESGRAIPGWYSSVAACGHFVGCTDQAKLERPAAVIAAATLRFLSGGRHSISPLQHTIQVQCSADQRQMCKCLRKIP